MAPLSEDGETPIMGESQPNWDLPEDTVPIVAIDPSRMDGETMVTIVGYSSRTRRMYVLRQFTYRGGSGVEQSKTGEP